MSDDDIQQLTTLLQRVEAGFLPEPVFIEIARLAVLPAVEFVPLRFADAAKSRVEVLLLVRPESDPVWAGKLHTPGTIVRPSDTSLQEVFVRLATEELGLRAVPELFPIGYEFHGSDRGSNVALEYIVPMGPDEPVQGAFYPVDDLPAAFIPEQQPMLERAVARFVAEYGPGAGQLPANQLH